MRPWTCLLPLFMVRWLARWNGNFTLMDGGTLYAIGPKGALFPIEDRRARGATGD